MSHTPHTSVRLPYIYLKSCVTGTNPRGSMSCQPVTAELHLAVSSVSAFIAVVTPHCDLKLFAVVIFFSFLCVCFIF